jgi:hypothetical protein
VIRPAGSARASRAPWASWAVGLAAAALLVISLSGYLFHRGQLADIAADHLRLRVLGPARLQAGVPSRYAIRTTSVTGYPLDAQIEFALYAPDGSPLMPAHKERADAEGSLVVTIPANLAFPADQTVPAKVKMEVVGKQGSREERLETYLAVEPVRYLTRLLVDKPVYRPGDTIRWRSLTLSRLGLAADRELPIRFAIVDLEGVPVAGSLFSAVTKRGVGSGEFCESRSLREGKYTLVAQSPDGSFPEQRTSFWLRKDRPPGPG